MEKKIISYMLRDIPEDLWRAVKSQAAIDGLSIKEVITSLLSNWIKSKKGGKRS